MAADGFLNFDTLINTSGFEKGTKNIGRSLTILKNQLRGLAGAVAAAFSVRQIAAYAKEAKKVWQIQLEAETKLETILGKNLGATEEQIKATKEWASELQKVGVIGDEIQLSGLQELATYIENADSLKTLNVVLNDMLAQQYGLNATAEEAVTISTMLGKVLNGQVTALSRYGYSFNEAQEQLLKYGTEEQRVATLAEVVEASVGGMNEALAKTPAGRLKQVSNTMGDIKELFGKAFTNVQALFIPALEDLASLLERIASLAVEVSESLAGIMGIELKDVTGIGNSISESVSYQDDLTESVEETTESQKKSLEVEKNSLANFDQINTVTTKTAETEQESKPGSNNEKIQASITPTVSEKEIKKASEGIAQKLSSLIKPIRISWEDKSPELIENAQRTADTIKDLWKSVGESISEVWANGSGERFISNILQLLSDVLGILGDITEAVKSAWADDGRGTALIQSYFDRWNTLLELIHAVSSAFREAWNDGTGEEIFSKIFDIITNINKIWSNLRTQFTEAWTENDRGTRIFSGILGIVNSVLGSIKHITGATAEWAKTIDFGPLLDSIAMLLEEIEPLTDNIGEGLAWFYENVLLPLGKWTLEKAVPTFLELLGSAIKLVNSVITVLKPAAKYFIEKFLKPIASWTGGAIITVLGTLSEALSNIAGWITKHKELISDIMVAIQSVTGTIITFFSQALVSGEEFTKISEKMSSAFSVAKDTVISILSSIGETVRGYLNGAETALSELDQFIENTFTSVYEFLIDTWNNIKKVFSVVGEWFKAQFTKAWNNIKYAWSVAVKWFTDVWTDIKKVFSVVANWFREQFKGAWDNIVNVFKGLGAWFSDRWNEIVTVFSAVGNWFRDRFNEGWISITDIFNHVYGYFSDRLNDIHNIFGSIGEWFEDRFRNAWDRVKNVFSGVRDFFGGIWSDISNGARDGINWTIEKINNLLWRLQDGINNIVNSINSALSIHIPDNVPVIGGTSFDLGLPNVHIPQIPYLAQGTYVPANYGNFLAVLGDNKREPEIVSPVSGIKSAVREVLKEQGGNDKPITVICMLDGREIGRVAVNAVNRDKALKGG